MYGIMREKNSKEEEDKTVIKNENLCVGEREHTRHTPTVEWGHAALRTGDMNNMVKQIGCFPHATKTNMGGVMISKDLVR